MDERNPDRFFKEGVRPLMVKKTLPSGLALLAVFVTTMAAEVAEPAPLKSKGVFKRTLWTMSRVKGSPDPPNPYRTEIAFPKLKFEQPLELTRAPGTKRLFVVERYGKIHSFVVDPGVARADLFIDLEKTT